MAYITTDDITDSIKGNFDLSGYITRADSEIINLARRFGLVESQIIEPIDYVIKQWAVSWVLMQLCLDKIGASNSADIANDKYVLKYDIYQKRTWDYYKRITKEMFTNVVYNQSDMVSMTAQIYRG